MSDINAQLAAIQNIGQEMDILLRIRDLTLFNQRLDEQQKKLRQFLETCPLGDLTDAQRLCLSNVQQQLLRHIAELHDYQQEIHQQVNNAKQGKNTLGAYRRISDDKAH
jgi:hypothetical protein